MSDKSHEITDDAMVANNTETMKKAMAEDRPSMLASELPHPSHWSRALCEVGGIPSPTENDIRLHFPKSKDFSF